MSIRIMYIAATIINISLFVASMVFLVLIITEDNGSTTSDLNNNNNNNVVCNSTTTTVTVYNNTCNSTCTEPVVALTEQTFDSRIFYDLKSKQFKLYRKNNNKDLVLNGNLGLSTETNSVKNVTSETSNEQLKLNFIYPYANITLTITHSSIKPKITCDTYDWRVFRSQLNFKQTFEDCFTLSGANWYGGAEAESQQFWPINNQTYVPHKPYLTGIFDASAGVMERYWLSSHGVAIIVDQSVPLFVSMNKTEICFLAKAEKPYFKTNQAHLKYDICTIEKEASDKTYLNNLQLYVIENYFKKPSGIPDELMFEKPIWSTWAIYKRDINETIVLEFADEINDHGYSNSQLEIDDDWQSAYGDFTFNPEKFPNVTGLVSELKNKGYRTTLWMHPFANVDSKNFLEQSDKLYWVRGYEDGPYPEFTWWWCGSPAVLLDATNPNATDWFVSELNNLKATTGIESFKFDAGEALWLPKIFWLYNETTSPDDYIVKYAEMTARLGGMVEVRTACQTQDLPIFVRMIDKDSRWGFDNGLKSLITTSLVMSILGYPFILPDMIGGNAYYEPAVDEFVFPEYDLFIRWTQANVFLPSMQFSIPPWYYKDIPNVDVDVDEICREMVELHENITTVILELAKQSVKTGEPIIRPMWWIDNSDANNLIIDDQFLVGDKYLVAPIVVQDAYQRDIYLPIGEWIDGNNQSAVYTGPMWYRNYSAPIQVIPYFINNDSIY